jgi:predicted  nucleic acid-binding Zn-ribbon protein
MNTAKRILEFVSPYEKTVLYGSRVGVVEQDKGLESTLKETLEILKNLRVGIIEFVNDVEDRIKKNEDPLMALKTSAKYLERDIKNASDAIESGELALSPFKDWKRK